MGNTRPRLGSRRLWAGLGLLALLTAWAFFQGDLLEEFTDIRAFFVAASLRFGLVGSLLLLYAEESGLPLPIPGDAILIYLGSHPQPLLAAALAILAVCAGASNLYWLSRRFGPRLLASPWAGRLFHLTPARAARAHAWFARWGALAVIFGRHVPGLRIPMTVIAGTFGLPYRVFLPSLALSATLWVALWMTLAARFAPSLEALVTAHTWLYALFAFFVLASLLLPLLPWPSRRAS